VEYLKNKLLTDLKTYDMWIASKRIGDVYISMSYSLGFDGVDQANVNIREHFRELNKKILNSKEEKRKDICIYFKIIF
jgi:hypothetical protein